MSFLGGIVGIPSKGKSIVAISSKTSACRQACGDDESCMRYVRAFSGEPSITHEHTLRALYNLVSVSKAGSWELTSASGGISMLLSESQAPLPKLTPPPVPPAAGSVATTSLLPFALTILCVVDICRRCDIDLRSWAVTFVRFEACIATRNNLSHRQIINCKPSAFRLLLPVSRSTAPVWSTLRLSLRGHVLRRDERAVITE